MPQYLYKLAINPDPQDSSNPTIFAITSENPIAIPPLILTPGDIAIGNGKSNVIDLNDYTQLKVCYDNSSSCQSTPDGVAYGDLDDNGVVDIVDFNIWIRSIYQLLQIQGSCDGLTCKGK